MDEHWQDIQALFDEVVELEPAAREARLAEADRVDPARGRKVRALLTAYARRDDVLGIFSTPVAVPPEPASRRFDEGALVGSYSMLHEIGRGGMGVVYRAYDPALDRAVALKFLPLALSTDESAKARFLTEARAAAALDHRHIATIFEIGETGEGGLFIAMPYYGGGTLKQKLDQGPLPLDEALDLARQVADGLAAAHTKNIIHRDVKPANVMVTGAGVVKIVDFGLAKMGDLRLTKTGTTLGTLAYMSPEQLRREAVDARADVWSLGVVLYEMLTGERPFRGASEHSVLYAVLHEEPAPIKTLNPAVPEALEAVVRMCLEKDPSRRYPTMAALLADLEILAQRDDSGVPASLYAAQQRRRKRRRGLLIGLGMAALLFLLVMTTPSLRQVVTPDAGRMHLAVLPFDNVGGDPADQPFIDGLAYTLTSKLAGLEGSQERLSVVPAREVKRTGVMDAGEAARALQVNLVVTGSVQHLQNRLILTLDLVDARTGRQLDGAVLNAPLMEVTDGMIFKLAGLLDVEVNPASRLRLTAGGTTAPGAFEFYTQALGYLQRTLDPASIDAAISLLQRAIDEDSTYALAYARLSEAYLSRYQHHTRDRKEIDEAVRYAQHALRLNDQLAPVHVSLGRVFLAGGRFADAEAAFLEALALEPNHAEAYRGLARAYARQQQLDLAEAAYQRAIELKRDYWGFYNDLGVFYHRSGRHEESARQFEQVTILAPDNPHGFNDLAAQYHRMGRMDAARQWYQRSVAVKPTAVAYRNLGDLHYEAKEFAEAAGLYEQARALQDFGYENWDRLANAYHWMGQAEKARQAWQRTIDLALERIDVNPLDELALGVLAGAYAKIGESRKAQSMIKRLLDLPRQEAGTLFSVALAYEILDARDQALTYLEKALALGLTPASVESLVWLDDLRTDPGYQALIQQYHTISS